ncbi:MAG: Flp pilus assembly complex ATPase component TadA, partial [Victivallales bacterium]|nr:Flp pilus assembly complex ATPase component TadA [Victivallales bacterium]
MARARLAEILQKRNLVSDDQYEQARRHARGLGDHAILHALGDLGFISGEAAIDVLSEHLAIPRIDLSEDVIDPQVSHLLPEELLRRHTLFPFQIENDSISLAICPPIDLSIVDEIELTTGYSVTTFLAPENEIRLALNQHFNTQRRTRQTILDMHVEEQIPLESGELVIDDVLDAVDSPPVVRLVVDIIDGAINERASDIHLEPQEDTLRIRYRIDGVLHDVMQIPRHVEASVISRIKILSNMDITEKRASQDGHISIKKGSGEYDIRV